MCIRDRLKRKQVLAKGKAKSADPANFLGFGSPRATTRAENLSRALLERAFPEGFRVELRGHLRWIERAIYKTLIFAKNKCLAESTPDGVRPTANSGGLRSDPAGA